MYYKVIHNNRVIDILDHLTFLKYQPKHRIMVLCSEAEAQAIMSSDHQKIWHEVSMYQIPVSGYDTVKLEPIDRYEYEQLKNLNCQTPEEIIDNYTLSLIEGGVL